MINVKIKALREGVQLPAYATEGSAAVDLRYSGDKPLEIAPGERTLVPTGIAIAPETKDVAAILCARSGLASKRGLTLSNGIGVIDSDYRGEIHVGLHNCSAEPYTVQPGERIAQMIIMPYFAPQILEVTSLSDTERGAGGFGSTGK